MRTMKLRSLLALVVLLIALCPEVAPLYSASDAFAQARVGIRRSKRRCRGAFLVAKRSRCDADKDGLKNIRETRLGTKVRVRDTDDDGTTDGAEVLIYKTNPLDPDSDDDGIADGDEDVNNNGITDEDDLPGEGPTHEDDNDPSGANCGFSPFDVEGSTTSFEIPQGNAGNIPRGEIQYQATCARCHSGATKGLNQTYTQLNTAISGPPMFITTLTTAQIADLVAFVNKSKQSTTGSCPNPSESPSASPSANPSTNPNTTPPGTCVPNPFDANGTTTSFGIPSGVGGNITRGISQWAITCQGCHPGGRGTNFTFPVLQTAIQSAPMFITTLNNQQIADLTAYVNQSKNVGSQNCPGTGMPTPTPPAPPPVDDKTAGKMVYEAVCLRCHTNRTEFRNLTRTKLDQAIREKRQMRGITLSEEQYRVLFIYLRSL